MTFATHLQALFELAYQFLLLVGQVNRGLQLNLAEQVAGRATANRGGSPAAQTENLTGLRAGWNLQRYLARQRWNAIVFMTGASALE